MVEDDRMYPVLRSKSVSVPRREKGAALNDGVQKARPHSSSSVKDLAAVFGETGRDFLSNRKPRTGSGDGGADC